MRIHPRLILLLFSVLGGAGYCVAEEPVTSPVDLESIAKRLKSEEFKEREAALRELDKVPYRQLTALEELAKTATDPESKSRLQERSDAIREEHATNPPPISLELTDAPLSKTVEALGKATGTAMTPWPRHFDPRPGRTFTISAKERPFWEVFDQLSQQHGLEFMGSRTGLEICQVNSGWIHGAITGPFAVFPMGIDKYMHGVFQGAPGGARPQPEQMKRTEQTCLRFRVAADPRLVLIKFASTEFTEIKDDSDNELSMPLKALVWRPVSFGETTWIESTDLKLPDHPGKKIKSAKGIIRCVVGMAFERLEVTEPEKKLGQPLKVAGRTIVIRNFDVTGAYTTLQAETPGWIGRNPLEGASDSVGSVLFTLIDANNQRLHSPIVKSSSVAGPLKLEIAVSTKVKELALPFELKDLPLSE